MAKLYVVPTPVGNLADMTFRAISVLKEAVLILAEDTRTSGVLLKHYEIDNKLFSYHQHNEHKVTDMLVKRILGGETMAIISDAGTPGISDAGFMLVRACVAAGVEVECLPGATALIPALVMSGFPSDRFCFEGFLPVKKGRKTRIQQLASEERTMVFYESPHRLSRMLNELAEVFGMERQAVVSREISKKFAENIRGTLELLIKHFEENPARGEFVVVVAGNTYRATATTGVN